MQTTRASRFLATPLLLTTFVPLARAADQAPAPAQQDQPPAVTVAQTPPPIELGAMVDVYSGYNFNGTSSGVNQMRAFDTQDGGFALNFAKITLARNKGPVGFRLDAGFGSASDALYAADPSSKTDSSNARWLSHIEQAYVETHIRGLTLEAGKFVTQHGYEVIESKDNWNYSRSLLFSWAIPFLHTGLRASYALNDKVSLMACWVNGWNSVVEEGNSMRSGGFQVTYKPVAPLTLVLNYMPGLEHQVGVTDLTMRHLIDASATYVISDRVSVAANGDYGHDAAMGGVNWSGVAGYGRVQALPWLAAAARFEYLADSDGFMTGVKQNVVEGTLTGEVSTTIARTAVLVRLEYRHDHSDAMVFDGTNPTSKRDQDTALVGAVAAF